MRLKHYLMIIILILACISGWRMGEPHLKSYMFASEIDDQTRFMNFGTAIRARNRVMDSVRQLDLPVTEDQLIVIRDESKNQLYIEARYSMTTQLPFGLHSFTWHFNPRSEYRMGDVPELVELPDRVPRD